MVLEILKQWLIFFRAHTGILEAPIPAMGAALALGGIWRVEVILWAFVGLLYHYAGYGQNSYYDWEGGYDKGDPHKQHHPLNTGAIKPSIAKIAANGMVFLTLLVMLLVIGPEPLPIALLLIALICGLIYNTKGKELTHKYLFISVAHSMLFLIPYSLYTGTITPYAFLVFVALVVHHSFQIAISGDMKDIMQDESSVLDAIGIRVTDECIFRYEEEEEPFVIGSSTIVHTKNVDLVIAGVAGLQIGILLPVMYELSRSAITDLYFIAVFSGLSMSLFLISLEVVKRGVYDRSERMRNIALRELVGFWLIYAALIPVIGFDGFIVGFTLCILYLVGHSRFMWGTLLRPKV